ncbi:MAG: type II toxin-antitoxin system VapC family toxin [Thermoleophilaceae bacterium]
MPAGQRSRRCSGGRGIEPAEASRSPTPWRRAARAGRLEDRRARQALTDLAALPLARAPHQPLLSRIWELRDNIAPYHAAYIALAEALETALLTADRRLTQAPGSQCEIKLLR